MITYMKALFLMLPPPTPGPPGPPGVPIDNGLIFLFIAAIILGVYYNFKSKKLKTVK